MSAFVRTRRINVGGQGEVWEAEASNGKRIAVKYLLLAGSEAQREEDLRRFQKEITCQRMLSHQGVLPVLSMDLECSDPHFSMPLADRSLRDVLEDLKGSGSGLPEETASSLFVEILEAVAYAHGEGVIHRDLKPENILFLGETPVISDFGLGRRLFSESTRLTMTNAGMGTVGYSAPEQFGNAKEVDSRADIYALGCIFYEMLTSEIAFHGIDLDLLPAEYRFLIAKATKRSVEQRFDSVDEMLRELEVLQVETEETVDLSERAKTLMGQIAAGDTMSVDELVRVFLMNSDDLTLHLDALPSAPEAVLGTIATKDPESFLAILQAFDLFADSRFPFDFTDRLGAFLGAVSRVSADQRVQEIVLRRLLILGNTHHRFYVRRCLVNVVHALLAQPENVPMIAAVLRDNPDAADFAKSELLALPVPLPSAIRLALAA